jgi:hypothetical protein
MADRTSESIIAELNQLEDLFLQCRSVFPALGQGMVGGRHFPTAPYYMRRGYQASIHLKEPITEDFIEKNCRLGKWLNENAIIRLYGILEHHGLLKKIDQTIPGWKEVDLLRRMRNAFTKTSLNYMPKKQENATLRVEVMKHFQLREEDLPSGEIPTPIHKVVEPIFKACRAYVASQFRMYSQQTYNDR